MLGSADGCLPVTADYGVIVTGGNARLIQALTENVPVLYSMPVREIYYGSSGITVVTQEGRAISADACVVTVPLGVLKAGHIDFKPQLPPSKVGAISRLGCVT